VPGVRYTTIATRYDGIVTPYRSQFLDGGRNIGLQDLCANDFADHLALLISASTRRTKDGISATIRSASGRPPITKDIRRFSLI